MAVSWIRCKEQQSANVPHYTTDHSSITASCQSAASQTKFMKIFIADEISFFCTAFNNLAVGIILFCWCLLIFELCTDFLKIKVGVGSFNRECLWKEIWFQCNLRFREHYQVSLSGTVIVKHSLRKLIQENLTTQILIWFYRATYLTDLCPFNSGHFL